MTMPTDPELFWAYAVATDVFHARARKVVEDIVGMMAACHGPEDFRDGHNFLKITLSWLQETRTAAENAAPATSEDGISRSAEQLAQAGRLLDQFDNELVRQAQLLRSRFLKIDRLGLTWYSEEIRCWVYP
jgi:hypothetical protein